MNDPRDHELSRIYREGAWPEPRRQLDEAVLEASRRAARARRSASFVWRWAPRFALVATVVLTSTLVLRVYQEQPEMIAPPAREVRPAPRVRQPAAPAPEAKAESAVPMSAPLEKKRTPEPAGRREESMQLRYQSSPAQPEVAAGAEKGFASDAARADRIPQQSSRTPEVASERQPEPVRAPRPMQESPSTLPAPAASAPGAGVLGGINVRSSALERSAETWLEDIRKLKAQGKNEDVQRELAAFKKRYPDYQLPDDLR